MNYTKIDWPLITGPLMTWNPIVGCKRDCSKDRFGFDCYAQTAHYKRHIAYTEGKLQNHSQYAKPFNKIQLIESRLSLPYKRKKPATVFINSVSDPEYWKDKDIIDVISVCSHNPQHTFLLLTKNPACLVNWCYPDNMVLGLTLTGIDSLEVFEKKVEFLKIISSYNRTFISYEPILRKLPYTPTFPKLIILGADTSKNPVIPKKDWILSINHPNIHYKKTVKKYLI